MESIQPHIIGVKQNETLEIEFITSLEVKWRCLKTISKKEEINV